MRLILTALLAVTLSGCTWLDSYKTPIQQGRIITQKQISQIKPGMTENQVKFILGTPSIQDPLHPNMWNYTYTHKIGGYKTTEKKLIVTFKDGKLVDLSGDYTPPVRLKYQYNPNPSFKKPVKKAAPKPKAPAKPKAVKAKTQKKLWMLS